jgi:16S rRNA (guanine527-N7)-methyltransferase
LESWNERCNLTAIDDTTKIRIKHFLDSFTCFRVMRGTPLKTVVDVGTGAGFPGIPLKILFPDIELVLVDSVQKKTDFCAHIVQLLKLDGVRIIWDRVERLGKKEEYRETFDWAVARAVAQLSELTEYLLPLVRIGGNMLAMKGSSGPQEAQQALNAIKVLGGHLEQVEHLTLPGVAEDRYLIVIKKIAPTPDKYPRRVGIPAKRPL